MSSNASPPRHAGATAPAMGVVLLGACSPGVTELPNLPEGASTHDRGRLELGEHLPDKPSYCRFASPSLA